MFQLPFAAPVPSPLWSTEPPEPMSWKNSCPVNMALVGYFMITMRKQANAQILQVPLVCWQVPLSPGIFQKPTAPISMTLSSSANLKTLPSLFWNHGIIQRLHSDPRSFSPSPPGFVCAFYLIPSPSLTTDPKTSCHFVPNRETYNFPCTKTSVFLSLLPRERFHIQTVDSQAWHQLVRQTLPLSCEEPMSVWALLCSDLLRSGFNCWGEVLHGQRPSSSLSLIPSSLELD